MSILGTLHALPVKAPLDTFCWLAGKIHDHAVEAYADPNRVTAALMALEDALERGELCDEAFEEQEAALLAELKEIKAFLAAGEPRS